MRSVPLWKKLEQPSNSITSVCEEMIMSEEDKIEEKVEEQAAEEQIAETQTEVEIEEPKLEGLARIPNRDKGSSHKPPFVMMGILVVLFILSLVLAKVS